MVRVVVVVVSSSRVWVFAFRYGVEPFAVGYCFGRVVFFDYVDW